MKGEAISILLIEDNFDHAEIIKRCFESHRIENKITHLSDGEQAVNFLFRQKSFAEKEYTLPNLILLDLRLPKIDGLEVLTKVKQEES
jgi:CheY-like chemotaxis protein